MCKIAFVQVVSEDLKANTITTLWLTVISHRCGNCLQKPSCSSQVIVNCKDINLLDK